MIKKLYTFILAFLPVVPLMAQPEKTGGNKDVSFAPEKASGRYRWYWATEPSSANGTG